MADKDSVGAKIRALRESHGLSQLELANLVGVRSEAISLAERGKTVPHARTLEGIARVLGVKLEEILGRPLYEPPPSPDQWRDTLLPILQELYVIAANAPQRRDAVVRELTRLLDRVRRARSATLGTRASARSTPRRTRRSSRTRASA
jgi:transcriptional regulator with XRE-family HTH domain